MIRGLPQPLVEMAEAGRLAKVLAVALAVLTGVLIFAALHDDGGSLASAVPATDLTSRTVLTAAEPIPAGTQITAEMLAPVSLPETALLPGVQSEAELVVGSFARIPILPGEQIVGGKLTTAELQGAALSFVIPAGRRAVAIRVDKVIGAGGLLRPGDRVDLFAVVTADAPGTLEDGARAVILAQYIEVLAVEQELVRVLPEEGNTERTATLVDQAEAQPASSVATLALTPQEAADLLVAEGEGRIRVAVRAPGDTAIVTLAPAQGLADPSPLARELSLAAIVPAGHRALGVQVNRVTSAGGLVRPGDHVDVIAVLEVDAVDPLEPARIQRITRSMTLVQNVLVLAVEQALEDATAADLRAQPAPQPNAIVVTLALIPEAAQQVFLAQAQGEIRLSVRPVGDDTILPVRDTAFISVTELTDPIAIFTSPFRSIAR